MDNRLTRYEVGRFNNQMQCGPTMRWFGATMSRCQLGRGLAQGCSISIGSISLIFSGTGITIQSWDEQLGCHPGQQSKWHMLLEFNGHDKSDEPYMTQTQVAS